VARRAGCNAVSLHCPVLTFLTVPGAQYRHVVLPQDIAQLLPKGRLLSEARRPTGMLLYASGPPCLAVAHRRPCWRAERVEGDWRSAEPWLGALRHPPTRASHHALQVGPPRHARRCLLAWCIAQRQDQAVTGRVVRQAGQELPAERRRGGAGCRARGGAVMRLHRHSSWRGHPSGANWEVWRKAQHRKCTAD